MKILKKIISKVILVIIILIIIITVYAFFQVNVFHKTYINLLGYTFFEVGTGSMEPTIKIGDIVIEKIVKDKEKLGKNDIISYKKENTIITHRIIDIQDNYIITKGDYNNKTDTPFEKKEVIGKVIKIIPNISILVKVIKTKKVYMMIIATIIMFIITFSVDINKK